MNIIGSDIVGIWILNNFLYQDDRGSFSRLFCLENLKEVMGNRMIVQINHSITRNIGAIRGMHFQKPPYSELKIIRCIKGRVFDVAIDLRAGSPTFLKWVAIELAPENYNAIVIPEGCAHGFQVLEKDSELLYLHTMLYTPQAEGGVRFDDPKIAIKWPLTPLDISERDLTHLFIDENYKGIFL